MKAMTKSTDNWAVAGKNYVFAGFVYEAFVDLKTELDWKSRNEGGELLRFPILCSALRLSSRKAKAGETQKLVGVLLRKLHATLLFHIPWRPLHCGHRLTDPVPKKDDMDKCKQVGVCV